MCGIALIIAGVRIDLSSFLDCKSPQPSTAEQLVFSVDDLKPALLRRGPDSLGSKKVLLHRNNEEGRSKVETSVSSTKYGAELLFFGATLQLRGVYPIVQPLVDSLENILVYNGEIFGGLCVGSDSNDGEVLMQHLGSCCSCNNHGHSETCNGIGKGQNSIPDVVSTIKGPWAFIYWQNKSKTLWFGRDAFGRRSLLVHWPTAEDSRLLFTSVSPLSSVEQSSVENGHSNLQFWEELPCAVYSISMASLQPNECLVGEVRKHEWANPLLKELIQWERTSVIPETGKVNISHKILGPIDTSVSVLAQRVLMALRKSVMQRTSVNTIYQAVSCDIKGDSVVPVAILFSGGLDSMILAALSAECLDPSYEIDLLNVSFDGPSAPDRISANAGLKELRRIAPLRRWNLVEIDANLSKLTWETEHVMSLINPANTYMDLNIGIALWLAAGGDGWVYEGNNDNNNEVLERVKYKSNSRILLVGAGADEQCAGYGRHRTKYRNLSWHGLHEEMKLDMQRIWKRNLGRDDRCIADNGKEARFPFLDEDVIRTLLDIPLWEIANLDQPSGIGDKKILREVAKLLGLHEASVLPKRAIQFGSRIARESNRKNFGSNRAANQASAGSVVIPTTP